MGFEERAHGWLAWARTPGHDAYWTYRDAFFDLVPAPSAVTLEVDPAGRYVVGLAEARPFDDGAFDLVVAYNSLMDVEDMPVAVREATRVLALWRALKAR